ncbi:outer membrane lipoprotein carrier protein LolA [Rhodohalobacter sp. WB101]|uniref:Outer membrane lipoprotein carrier protein LolA n=2 Tax=Rhodohalobacter sulfatireducens TaxID=2911366 RepID=A0ABS9KCN8_9BACT|nr:outer membrane lipoprotein carrier protein LolA [Rhodohalobacter sulfatireducens]
MRYLMNLVFKQITILLLMVVLAPALGVAQDTPQFEQLKQKFEDGLVFESDFIHEYNDTFTGDQQITEGRIWVGKEQYKMRSGESVMLVDGEISKVYDSTKNRVITSDYIEEEDDFAPSRMLQGVDDSYSVEEQSEENQTVIELTSDDPFSIFMSVSIFLNPSGIPTRIVAIDQVENELVTTFNEGSFIQKTPEIFQFQYPEDAEEIDLRHDS